MRFIPKFFAVAIAVIIAIMTWTAILPSATSAQPYLFNRTISTTGQDMENGYLLDITNPFPSEVNYLEPANYFTLIQWYKDLEANYSKYLEVFKANELYGTGQIPGDGIFYDAYYIRLTNETRGLNKPESLFLGGPHGDETAGTVSMYWFCDWLLRHAFDPTYMGAETTYLRWILDNREIYIEASHNPYGYDKVQRLDYNNIDLNREADMDSANPEFGSVQGKTLREFVNHHQIRTACDFHGGVREILYPWASTHDSINATSQISGRYYNWAPPDFNFFDASSLRLGSYMGTAGGYGGELDKSNIGTIPDTVGYEARGGMCPWAYGGDIDSNLAETPYVKYPPYPGAGILWLSPEISPVKNPPGYQFGGDDTPGYGMDIRRLMLHQADIAQPYVKWYSNSVKNNTEWAPGQKLNFKWQVNGSMVVDHTQIVWGNNSDLINNPQHLTTDYDTYKGLLKGGTGWEGAFDGKLPYAITYQETIQLPYDEGDYYFIARAMVDQAYNTTLAPQEYGNNSYLRLIKERCWQNYTETIANSTDGNETLQGRKWWYSQVIHVRVNASIYPFLEVDLTAPKGGEKWYTGKTYSLNFTIFNGTPDYKIDIYLSPDDGYTWNINITKGLVKNINGDHVAFWTVPYTLQNGTVYKMKVQVQDSNTDVGTDTSKRFEIVHTAAPPVLPSVTVLKPSGGQKWLWNETCPVAWNLTNATGPIQVSIYMSSDSGISYPYVITTGLPQAGNGPGSYDWNINPSFPASTHCRVRVDIVDNNMATAYGTSSTFEIGKNGTSVPPEPNASFSVRLSAPNGGESLNAGSTFQILWQTYNGTKPITIDLDYSSSGPTGPFSEIAYSISDTGAFVWTVPDITSTACYVRITATDFKGNISNDKSDAKFALLGNPAPSGKGNVTGHVSDKTSGAPMKSTSVSIYRAGSTDAITTEITDTDGYFVFYGMNAGTYDIKASITGYKEEWVTFITVTNLNTTHIEISISKNTVTPPPQQNTTTTLPFGVGYECLSFLVLASILGIAALTAISSHKKRLVRDSERVTRTFQPVPKPTNALQDYLMRGPDIPDVPPPSRPPPK